MSASRLRGLAIVSGFYDLALAVPMLLAPVQTALLFGAPAPVPVVNAQLNGVFTLSLAAGYFWAAADPLPRRGYLWVAGVLAKGLGVALFLARPLLSRIPGVIPGVRGERRIAGARLAVVAAALTLEPSVLGDLDSLAQVFGRDSLPASRSSRSFFRALKTSVRSARDSDQPGKTRAVKSTTTTRCSSGRTSRTTLPCDSSA